MVKFSFFGLLLALSLCSFAGLNFRQLKKVKSCELIAEKGAVFPGEEFSVFLKIELLNGTILYSNLNNGIGFNDFEITLQGAKREVPIVQGISVTLGKETIFDSKNNKLKAYENSQLDLSTNFELINRPFVLVKAQLIDYPEISCELSMPIHFNGVYKIDLNGLNGDSGRHGKTPVYRKNGTKNSPAVIGYPVRESSVNGANGRNGLKGEQGDHGKHGSDGEDLDVFVSLVDCKYEAKKLIRLEISPYQKETSVRYLEINGRIMIATVGGDGGNGGNGGMGGDGRNGQNGHYRYSPKTGDPLRPKDGKGGNGGHGGHGGYGGNAGYGGNGGTVNIFIEEAALFFKDRIIISNNGGNSGEPGKYGFGGFAGASGDGGKGKGANGRSGKNGLWGYYGAEGISGSVNYVVWN